MNYLLNLIPGYLGNKSKMISIIGKEIDNITKKGGTICDLFSGSGVVGDFLKDKYRIIANDIEYYSYITNKVNLNLTERKIKKINLEEILKNLEIDIKKSGFMINLDSSLKNYLNKIEKKDKSKIYFFYNNFSGKYFSVNQCLEIDFYRLYIEKNYTGFEKDYLIGLGIYGLYNIVNSVGNHFAQPRLVKEKNLNIILKKFKKSFFDTILKKHLEILNNSKKIKKNSEENIVENLDYKLFLEKDYLINTFYIDTPYTIDHYSRFYHILDTFAKYDYPKIEGKGLYRTDRFQSPFCLKTKVKEEFEYMISTIFKKHSSNIVLSYSDSYRSLLHKDQILEIFNKYYDDVKLKEINYIYSGLGQSSGNNSNELLFIAKYK